MNHHTDQNNIDPGGGLTYHCHPHKYECFPTEIHTSLPSATVLCIAKYSNEIQIQNEKSVAQTTGQRETKLKFQQCYSPLMVK